MYNVTSIVKDRNMVPFGEKLAGSVSFKGLFKEGMTLVEEAAAYLDGPGRKEAKLLQRGDALAYASESMRLTTRLMQLASWLLLQRAVNEGELTQKEAAAEKHRVKLSRQDLASNAEVFTRLPQRLRELSLQSLRLQARIQHLDQVIYPQGEAPVAGERPRGIETQLNRLREAFPQS
jgi:regulator of CtrA degradation